MITENEEASDSSAGDSPGVDWLVGQLKRMAPHLDTYGRAYCGDLGRGRDGKGAWPLDSEPVSTLLAYRHRLRHGLLPTKAELEQARTLVVGGLWEARGSRSESGPGLPLVVETLLAVAKETDEFLGSASDVLTLLKNHLKKHPAKRRQVESLPGTPEQMGMALGRYAVILREHGVEIFRPRRSDVKRWWAWRCLEALTDSPDGSDGKQTDTSLGSKEQSSVRSDGSDTLDDRTSRRIARYRGGADAPDAA